MIRVIDVDALMMMAEGVRNGVLDESDYYGFAEAFYCGIRKYVDEYAKIIEYEPNIPCKDCKHWQTDITNDLDPDCRWCGKDIGYTDKDFFCAYGERKDEQDH